METGSYLKPVGILRALLCSQDLNKAFILVASHVARICTWQVTIQRCRVELSEYVNLVDVTVDAVADRNVDEAVICP